MVNRGVYALPPEPYIDGNEELDNEGVVFPHRFSTVHVSSFTNPFSEVQVTELNHRLQNFLGLHLDDENTAVTVWRTGINFYNEVYA